MARASSVKAAFRRDTVGRCPAEFVLAATEMPNERVPGTDHLCRVESFQAAHRPQAVLQKPLIIFDEGICVLHGDVARQVLNRGDNVRSRGHGRLRPTRTAA